ncbi:thiosulfate oxidation carrier complex protein SoxZ [Solemya velesiana gill symbiont]|uniref:Thiosulfate oxidation carrier complex protein SoxZ n=1 Tax=Solemya velesiana gill symbiont TaxID=1918948 RepID=A0A1T2KU76_9GAMM|nr:thiosulfate oxidation carrier complex protein SoxZ [Solemya velesiana gill symbiont]OOZ36372.1 thiosulfate oxidation carrier complex protein SoxZ [Solemya velesiana gill symbiont]
MAKKTIKIRAKDKDGVVTVKSLMTHPMQPSGQKDKKTGKPIPPHYIQEVTCESGGKTVMSALLSGGVSKNPYVSFKFTGAKKGDMMKLSWMDNQGETDSAEAKIG